MGGGGGKGHSSVPNKPRQKIVLNKSENIKKKKKKSPLGVSLELH